MIFGLIPTALPLEGWVSMAERSLCVHSEYSDVREILLHFSRNYKDYKFTGKKDLVIICDKSHDYIIMYLSRGNLTDVFLHRKLYCIMMVH